MVAVVGARSCSRYAELVATDVGRALAGAGLVVVSGLARGIDSAAHRGALESGGPTIAVLGCGVDVVYPKRNRDLFDDIRRCGLLISEYADATPAAPFRFPARNRIIAALSIATVVIEGRKGSGALITADFALETGRDVFAVPWRDHLDPRRRDERAHPARCDAGDLDPRAARRPGRRA